MICQNMNITFFIKTQRLNSFFLFIKAIDPVRILIAVCIFSNIGGTATSVGDPPNVLIANDPT